MQKRENAEREFVTRTRLISGTDLAERDLDPAFARGSSLIPNRDIGMNLRSQLYPLSQDETEAAAGLIRYLGMANMGEFTLEASCDSLQSHSTRPLEFNLPVRFSFQHYFV